MSSVPEVLTALASLGVSTLPSTVQVINGDSGSVTTTRGRMLLVGDEEFEIEEEFDSLGGVTTTEHYAVPCAVISDVPTTDQSVADAQAWADYEAMKAAVISDPSLGLSASFSLQAAIVGRQRFRRLADPEGKHTLVRFFVDVFATSN